MKTAIRSAFISALVLASATFAEESSIAIESQKIAVQYAPPAAKNRASASFHSDADLAFKGTNVPKGDYTIYVLAEGTQWQLALNKATGAKAATYDPKLDLGRMPLNMSKPGAAVPGFKITLTKIAALAGRIEVVWNGAAAVTQFRLDRGGSDSEW